MMMMMCILAGSNVPSSSTNRQTPSDNSNYDSNPPDDFYDDDDDDNGGSNTGGSDYNDPDGSRPGSPGVLRDQGKTKRAQVGHPPVSSSDPAVYDPSRRRVPATAADDDDRNTSDGVVFRAHVQHRVTAYVTWPAAMTSSCTAAPDTRPVPTVAGYIFRYRPAETGGSAPGAGGDGDYIVRNLADNFVVLDNLLPNSRYVYQVRYVFDKGGPSAWSQLEFLDTTYNTQAPSAL